jgi:PKD repeat protein
VFGCKLRLRGTVPCHRARKITAIARSIVVGIAVSVVLTGIPAAWASARTNVPGLPKPSYPAASSTRVPPPSMAFSEPPVGNQAMAAARQASSPPAEYGGSMVYDAADGYELYYGGGNYSADYASTWIFSQGNWTNITSTAGTPPSPRQGMSMTYDASDGYVLAYGGSPSGLASCPGRGGCNDTWAFQDGHWKQLNPSVYPLCHTSIGCYPDFLPGGSISITYDAADGYVVMFDGNAPGIPPNYYFPGQETWAFRADNWTELNNLTSGVALPPPVGGMQLVYDNDLQEAIMFGGSNGTANAGWNQYDTTWAWSHGAWTNLSSSLSVHPSHRDSYGLAYDSASSELVLFGGLWTQCPDYTYCGTSPGIYLNDTWIFNANGWTNVTSAAAPENRGGMAMAYDPFDGSILMFGGFGVAGPLGDTWAWSGTANTWALVYGSLTVSNLEGSPNPATFGAPVNFNATVAWGTSPYSYSWNFGDGTTGGNLATITHAYTTDGPFQVVLTVKDAVGDVAHGFLNVTIQLQAQLHASATTGGPPLAVQFSGSAVGGVPPYAFAWNFGDGSSISHAQDPAHTYNGSRVYTVLLTVVDSHGEKATSTLKVSTLGFLGLPHDDGYFLLAGLAASVIALAMIVRRRVVGSNTIETAHGDPPDAFREFKLSVPHSEDSPPDTLGPGESDPAGDLF